ncbi:MAG: SDR family oxidoreductase [Acidimicrobiales bacterium]|nr:SDR family oxidoreductase [Acidimicrobiales bacterium]
MIIPPAEMLDQTGKVVVVTGGSRGIGRALVQGFAAAGADVVIASRKLDNCEALAAEVRAATGEFGRCDVLINNAGMSPLYPDLVSVSEDLYDKVHAVNAKGPFRLSSLIGTRMAEGDGGVILNVTTAGSLRPNADDLPYAMAKAGLNALTLALAGAWAPKVRANLLMPGAFDTDIAIAWGEEAKARIGEMNPMGRMGRPEDMVGIALLLASDAGSYINGAQILMDGGLFRTL